MSGTQDPQPNQKSVPPVKAGSGGRRGKIRRTGLTYERVRELFDYHEDGYLVRRAVTNWRLAVGQRAGSLNKSTGYVNIKVDKNMYQAHRIIWLWHYGYIPEKSIDHINRVKSDNRISNLRETSQSCNMRNASAMSRRRVGEVRGTSRHKSKTLSWMSYITVNYRRVYLGTFGSEEAAVLARYAAELEFGWRDCTSTSPAYLYLKERGLL